MITKNDLIRDLLKLGVVRGDTLNVKASIKSIGVIDGGANTLIEALLEVVGDTGTLVTDSFVTMYSPFSLQFWTNIVDCRTASYAGALANALSKYPGAIRSTHPVQKFALLGARAQELAALHTESSYAYEVLNFMAKTNGKNLKIGDDRKVPGVGTTHVAIGAGRIRQKRMLSGVRYRNKNGVVKSFYLNWAGGCMDAFYKLNDLYASTPNAVIGTGRIGNASSKLTSMGITLNAEIEALEKDPETFLRCGSPDCLYCRFSWENYEEKFWPFFYEALRGGRYKALVRGFLIKYMYFYKP